jgi:hypothetical protein
MARTYKIHPFEQATAHTSHRLRYLEYVGIGCRTPSYSSRRWPSKRSSTSMGVYRLGEEQFNWHVERLPIERKMQLLLLICDGLEVDKEDRLIVARKAVAGRRNALAHPKAKQVPRDQPAKDRTGWPIPETAQEQIQAMREFLRSSADSFPEVATSSG